MKTTAEIFQQVLCNAANPDRALTMRAYMKNQFVFFGVATPERRQLCRPLMPQPGQLTATQLIELVQDLWTFEQRELHYLAIDLLARHFRLLEVSHIDWVLQLAQTHSWWDTVDGLTSVIGDVLKLHLSADRHEQSIMDQALRHENFWIRRVAMLHQLGWRDQTDVARLFAYSLQLAEEKEFFIRKAIGWALRDYAWHDPGRVQQFLARHQTQLSGLSYREAAKNLHRLL
ncbi:MAG: DNA alkylation repair protein [Burkholderiales bacterium]|nr:DNA alkylation repair protein [Burkholderiales bacterium]